MIVSFALIFLLALSLAVMSFTLAWLVYLVRHNPAIVDFFWVLALCSIACVFAYIGKGADLYRLVFLLLVFIWALRLGGYLLFTRVFVNKQDHRYAALAERWQQTAQIKFLYTYLFQALLAACVSMALSGLVLPFGKFTAWFWVGLALFIIGFSGGLAADRQLQQFKLAAAQAGDQHSVFQTGLWRYSRHPKLFYEWLSWCGFAAISSTASYGWVAWVGPLVLLVVMLQLTIPLAEAVLLKTRGAAFKTYRETTSCFLPFPVKLF